ncbi:MAG TPA: PTS sugar transporter subunit IIB [Ktedonosporobacter sp.]|nr:PTS sugar transporter subunit IIB [Ktedonosporobacter sp.]
MPVIHMRIESRYIRNKYIAPWLGLKFDRYVVANDQVVNDKIQQMMLPQEAKGFPLSLMTLADALQYVNSEEGQKERIFLSVKTPQDALHLLEEGLKPAEINVGTQNPQAMTKYKMITDEVGATAEDAEVYRAIAAKGYTLTAKMKPSDPDTDFLELLKKQKL